MDGSKVSKGIMGAFLMLLGLVAVVGGLFLTQYIYAIILGSVFQVVQNGSLPVTASTTTFLNTTESSFFSVTGYINSGAAFAGGLIAVGVILIVFGGFVALGYGAYRKYKKGRSGGDMGY